MSLLVRSAAAALRRTRGFPQRRPYSGSSSRQPLDVDELKRSSILGQLEELDVTVKWEIVEDVEKLRRMQIEDRNFLGRLLTWCGVPKGEIRDKLVLGCNLSGMFCVAGAAGKWMAERDEDPESTPNWVLQSLGGK